MLLRIVIFCLMVSISIALTIDSVFGDIGRGAHFLPSLFRSKSVVASGLEILAGERKGDAADTARLGVLRRPLVTDSLTLLARANALTQPKMSSDALARAAMLGWRDASVQAAVVESAVRHRSWNVAAPRLIALIRMDQLDKIEPSVFRDANNHDYAPQLASAFGHDGEAWFKLFRWLRENELKNESDFFIKHTPLFDELDDCISLEGAASELVRSNQIDMAADLVISRCQKHATSPNSGLLLDEHFGDVRRGPFEWQILPHPGVSFHTEVKNGKAVVVVVNADPVPRKIATKLMRRESLNGSDLIVLVQQASKTNTARETVLHLDVKCVRSVTSPFDSKSTESRGGLGSCEFVRVAFSLPTGRSLLWSR